MNSKDAPLAAVTPSKFKVQWLKEEKKKSASKTLNKNARLPPTMSGMYAPPASGKSGNYFFTFHDEDSVPAIPKLKSLTT